MRYARAQRHVPVAMTDRKAKADRIVIFADHIADDLFRRRTERADRIFLSGKAADDQPGKPVEAAATLELAEHPVYVIEIFPNVFDEKDLSGCRRRRNRAGEVREQGQVAAGDRRYDLTGSVK